MVAGFGDVAECWRNHKGQPGDHGIVDHSGQRGAVLKTVTF